MKSRGWIDRINNAKSNRQVLAAWNQLTQGMPDISVIMDVYKVCSVRIVEALTEKS